MAQSSETKKAEIAEIIGQLIPMADAVEQGHIRPKYQAVLNVAHGWIRRIVRTNRAILLLQANGFNGEVAPLARSVVEHSVALRWLIADGEDIMAPLRTNHYTGTSRFFEAWRSSTTVEPDEEQIAEELRALENDDHRRDHLQQFAHRVKLYGTPSDLTVYQAELNVAHATYQSAAVYCSFDQTERLPEAEDSGNYDMFCAVYLYLAMIAFSAIFVARPWQGELAAIRARLIRLERDVDKWI